MPRYIDADALRTDFQERLKNCDEWIAKVANEHDLLTRALATRDFICEVLMTINNAPTIEERPKGKWIPVSERLPEDDEDVLVTRVYTESTHSFIDMVWFNKGKFLTQDGNLETSNVVAWMPLPEPYEKGGADMRKEGNT